jgi:glutamyl-tRNA synthetase
MPKWAHLPLILGPSGKLSKRDGAKYGFPVFAMNWTNSETGEITEGFRERGFLPQAFVNMLALLGWNDGTEEELFTLDELVERFSISKVHKGGAKFDFDKAKWFNHEWIKRTASSDLLPHVKKLLEVKGITANEDRLEEIISLVKDRCTFLPDFYEHTVYFFKAPDTLDAASVKPKWTEVKEAFFQNFIQELESIPEWSAAFIENGFKTIASVCGIKPGELQLPFRIMLVGGKFGPPVFDIAAIIGKEETIRRIRFALPHFKSA